MKEKKSVRSKWLTIRLSEEEEKRLKKICSHTTARGLSEYARKVLLQKPVTVLYRNASADQFLAEMLGLKTELNAIGINLNQAVHRLHTIDRAGEVKAWGLATQACQKGLQLKTEQILEKLSEIHALWLQK
ncbi:MAG TPA: hypothetical protein VMR70_18790 [Flavisolibacter sp.]|nr:hypothetical protein [Flavisolibacter sp.]